MVKLKDIAKESLKTKKIREKVEKHFAILEREVAPNALKQKLTEIQRWIAHHASGRVILRSKSISLFDENKNTAKLSQRIYQLSESLKTQR